MNADQAFTAADVSVPFGSESYKDSIYTHSTSTDTDDIVVNEDGWYKISYNVIVNNSGYNRDVMYHSWIEDDGSALKMSHSYGHTINQMENQGWMTTLGSSFIIYLDSGSIIDLHAEIGLDGNTFGDTHASIFVHQQGTYLIIEKID
jgi:hypothetical protein